MQASVKHGRIFMFDGPEGTGKTTQINQVAETLKNRGYKLHLTRAHGGTPIGEKLREVSLSDTPRSAYTDLYLSRTIHVALSEDLRNKKQEGYICLVDRSPIAMWAYQVRAGDVPEDYGLPVIKEDIEMLDADLIIVYAAPLDTLKRRIAQREDRSHEYFKSKSDKYHARIIAAYKETPTVFGATEIDASGDARDVHRLTMDILLPYMK